MIIPTRGQTPILSIMLLMPALIVFGSGLGDGALRAHGAGHEASVTEGTGAGASSGGSVRGTADYLSWDYIRDVSEPMFGQGKRVGRAVRLQEAIARALEHNLDIKAGSYDPAISMTQVVQAQAAFDAVFFSTAQVQNTDQGNPETGFITRTVTTPNGPISERVATDPFTRVQDDVYTVGLRKLLATGASIQVSQRLRRLGDDATSAFYDPFYETSIDVEIRQPLLRDFGIDVNRAQINAARNSQSVSVQQFNRLVIDIVSNVEAAYWQLVLARQTVRIRENLLRRAEVALEVLDKRRRYDADLAVVARNRGLIERARGDLVVARNSVLQRQEQLLRLLNDPNCAVGGLWEVMPSEQPTTRAYEVNREQAMQTALAMRPELIAQRSSIDTAGLALGVAENQLLPRLDLIARQEANGPGTNANDAWGSQWENDTANTLLGLSFEVPIGNRAAKANLVRRRHELQQSRLTLRNFEEQILTDVSLRLLDLDHIHKEIRVRLRGVEAETNVLRAYLAQEEADAAVTADFLNRKLDQEERLAREQAVLANAIARYNVAISDFQRAQGTLLEYNNIKLAELSEPVDAPR